MNILSYIYKIFRFKNRTYCAVTPDGKKFWYLNGKCHREDGPAIICPDGTQFWVINNKIHREDGPAVIYPDGSQFWYLNGRLHREDGPAIIYSNGTVLYFKHGQSFVKHSILLNPIKFTIKDGL